MAAQLRDLVHKLPEAAFTLPGLSDTQKDVLKSLRGGVPPQATLLADHLIRWVQDDPETRQELDDTGDAPSGTRPPSGCGETSANSSDAKSRGPVPPCETVEERRNDRSGVVESLRKAEAMPDWTIGDRPDRRAARRVGRQSGTDRRDCGRRRK